MSWDPDDRFPGTRAPAWDFIGYDGPHWLRIVGGRALYEAAIYYDDTPGDHVKLVRIDTSRGYLRQIERRVNPDTVLEVVAS
jgi:hypothetical protein